jgi:hypothetical protein
MIRNGSSCDSAGRPAGYHRLACCGWGLDGLHWAHWSIRLPVYESPWLPWLLVLWLTGCRLLHLRLERLLGARGCFWVVKNWTTWRERWFFCFNYSNSIPLVWDATLHVMPGLLHTSYSVHALWPCLAKAQAAVANFYMHCQQLYCNAILTAVPWIKKSPCRSLG